jgi:hypothetical protein
MTASIWPYTQERSTTYRFLVDLGTGLLLISEDPLKRANEIQLAALIFFATELDGQPGVKRNK